MKRSTGRFVALILSFCIVVFGQIGIQFAQEYETCATTWVKYFILGVSVFLEIFAMAYFIIQDIVANQTTIAWHGSLSLFETIDRTRISRVVIQKLIDDTKHHVIYINCASLPRNEVENIKQRLYEDLTNYKKILKENDLDRKKLKIGNVFLPGSFDMQTFNENVFYTQTRGKRRTIYVYDYAEVNRFFIQQIEKRLNGQKHSGINAAHTYIVYLTCADHENDSTSITSGKKNELLSIPTALDGEEIKKLLEARIPDFEGGQEQDFCDFLNKNKITYTINNVFVLDDILSDAFYRTILKSNPKYIYVLYFLKTGKYHAALSLMQSLYQPDDPYSQYMLADTLHLINRYADAAVICEGLESILCQNLKQKDCLREDCLQEDCLLLCRTWILHAHITKHIGLFSDADIPNSTIPTASSNRILQNLSEKFPDQQRYVVNKQTLNNYFDGLQTALHMGDSDANRSVLRTRSAEEASKTFLGSESPDDQMYSAAFSAYDNPRKALSCIDEVISYYEKTDSRRIYNALYIKAEILRVLNCFEEAYRVYLSASGMLDGHLDVNLLDQCYFSLKALEILQLAHGTASYQVMAYKHKYFNEKGSRNDIRELLNSVRVFFPHLTSGDEAECVLNFNVQLLQYFENKNLEKEKLQRLLAENIFIIL